MSDGEFELAVLQVGHILYNEEVLPLSAADTNAEANRESRRGVDLPEQAGLTTASASDPLFEQRPILLW